MSYLDEADALRDQLVPEAGQAPTVQGELLRSIDLLRAVAHDDRADWQPDHALLVDFLHEILLDGGLFDELTREDLESDLIAIGDGGTSDEEPYDRITERIVEYAELHPELQPHHPNPAITI
jgi:hypothetical protein